ncbi:receptor-type tyrosine-protein phosphatase alpha-like [Gigantopelta aegis]|uniref:receptor-type tyrosine-protein phosphatase alpha-like n=1 Tax=Gigantopelta aegis TaxID=1735272 RepID=UPI001B887D4B|nr:receptor-type tyrosine-protein phosphatase alpha-like [Gigantopelta aegis]
MVQTAGYREKKAFIIAQSPMENTSRDFWKMIMDYKVSAIVMLCKLEENGEGYSCSKKFIASQGPMKKTLVDFWRLVWQETPQVIVMVTNLKEGSKNKCEQYWPKSLKEPIAFVGPFTITLLDEQVLPDFAIRRLKIKVPILVHCSAGVGRTGTFIAVNIALEQASKEGVVDIAGIINRLREQRMKMVQTVDQYAFVHDAVLERVICGKTEILTDKYRSELQKLKECDPRTHQTGLESQFNLLFQLTPKPDDVHCNTAEVNSDKNRSDKYLPREDCRTMNGYREKKAFIIAQSPMENTTRDFWKIIMDYKVPAIVMLCELEENGERKEGLKEEDRRDQAGERLIFYIQRNIRTVTRTSEKNSQERQNSHEKIREEQSRTSEQS